MEKNVTIQSIPALKRQFGWSRLFAYPEHFQLEFPQLTEEEQEIYQNKLSLLSRACGCNDGKAFIVVFILSYAILFVMAGIKIPTHSHGWNIFLFAFAGAAFGKLFGLIHANVKIQRIIRALQNRVEVQALLIQS